MTAAHDARRAGVMLYEPPSWARMIETQAAEDARYIALFGGRGGGKSKYLAPRLIKRMVLDPHMNAACGREVQKSIDESVKPELVEAIQRMGVEDYFEVQDRVIRSRRGSGRIIFVGLSNSTADGFKSYAGLDVLYLEEAQAISKRSWEIATPTIRKPRSQIWAAWNPDVEEAPVDEFFRCNSVWAKDHDVKPPDNAVIVGVNYWNNPWFGDPLKTEMETCRARDPDAYAHIWCGEYRRSSEARIFKNWKVLEGSDDAADEAIARQIPLGSSPLFGADWGFAVDATAGVRAVLVGRTLFVTHEAVQVGCELDDTPALLMTIPGIEDHVVCADNNDQIIAHMRKRGFRKMMPAVKGPGSVLAGIKHLQGLDLVIHPRCKTLIRELTRYQWKVDARSRQVQPEPDEKLFHPNVIHALRYALESTRRFEQARPLSIPSPVVSGRFRRT